MIRGGNRYLLTADNQGRRSIQLRANYLGGIGGGLPGMSGRGITPESISGTMNIGLTNKSTTIKDRNRLERFTASIMDSFVDYESTPDVRALQMDMYNFDPIINSVVDIKSLFPYSNLELSGTSSKERRDKYTEAFNAMQLRSMFPKVTREKMVEGYHVSYMNFKDSLKQFTSIVPFNPEFTKITPLPVFGRDPLVDVQWPDYLKKLIQSDDEDIKAEIEAYAEDIVTMIEDKKTRLDPKFTLYLARTPFTWSPYGISALRKLIPIWLYEKALARGTIELSSRRQRPILHMMMGDMDWLPNNEQLEQLVELFKTADRNPVGAFVATRPGVEINEVMGGENHWRWDSCLSGDTLIPTTKGLVTIDSFGTSTKDIKIDLMGDKGIATANRFLYQGKKKVIKLTYENGMSLTCTPDHKIQVLDSVTKKLIWIQAKDVNNSHSICLTTKKITSKEPLFLNLSEPFRHKNNGKISKPEFMTPDLAFIVAAIVAEGNFDNSTVEFSNSNELYLKKYEDLMKKVFGLSSTRKDITNIKGIAISGPGKVKCYKIQTCSRQLCVWLRELGLVQIPTKLNKGKSPSWSKEVPWSILRADEESQKSYLASYIEGDGCICNYLMIYSVSDRNLRQLQALLLSHGFVSNRISYKCISMSKKDSLKLISGIKKYMVYKHTKIKNLIRGAKDFDRRVGIPARFITEFLSERRVSKLGRCGSAGYRSDEGVIVPDTEGIRDSCRKILYGSRSTLVYSDYKKGVYNALLELIKNISKIEYSKIVDLLEREYKFIKVASIKYLKNPRRVYDLSIDAKHNPAFTANGIIVHNCYDVFTTMKLRALGVSESIFSDFSVQTAEQTMSSFLEECIFERDELTHSMLMNKVFLIVAKENGYEKTEKQLTAKDDGYITQQFREEYNYLSASDQHVILSNNEVLNPADYDLPQVRWEKNLKVPNNDALFNNLGILAERGAPAPLRMQAAATGISFQDLLDGLDQDVKDRKLIDKYKRELPEDPSAEGGDGGGDAGMFMESSLSHLSPKARQRIRRGWRELIGSNPSARRERNFDNVVHRDSHTGKELSKKGLKVRMDAENRKIMEASERINAYREAKNQETAPQRERNYSYRRKGK